MGGKGIVMPKRKSRRFQSGSEFTLIGESDEWRSWYALSPRERWIESQKLWEFYIDFGGSLDPEPDCQSPFRTAWLPGAFSTHGRTGLRVVGRV